MPAGIQEANFTKFLGVEIDGSCNWCRHVESLVDKFYRCLLRPVMSVMDTSTGVFATNYNQKFPD